MFKASDYFGLLQQLEQFFSSDSQTQHLDPKALSEELSLDLPEDGTSLEHLQTAITNYLTHAVNTTQPTYFNQLWGGFNAASFMGDILTSAMNTSMYTYEVAPAATLIEKALIAKMGNLVGFSDPEGQFTTGGSNGNLMAVAIARHQILPTAKQTGMIHAPRLIAFASAESHYPFVKAAQLLGLGAEQVWKVPVDHNGRMIVAELEALIAKAHIQGAQPFFVVGTAGTTVRGAFDPFPEIAAVAQREKLWFHIDGSWGGGVLLSPTHRHLMQGAELADSVVWDAHKMMQVESLCAAVLYKDYQHLATAFQQKGSYLFHPKEELGFDTLPFTVECTKAGLGTRLFWTLAIEGEKGMGNFIHHQYQLTRQFHSIIDAHPDFYCPYYPEANILCFEYTKYGRDNDFQLAVRNEVVKRGKFYITSSEVQGIRYLRLTVMNRLTTTKHIEQLLEEIEVVAKKL